jgi:hypothetical protein
MQKAYIHEGTTIHIHRGGLDNMKSKNVILILVFFIGLMPVIMAPAPTAQTLSATNITQTSAVLRGKVNPNGLSTKVDFCSCDPSASPTYFPPTPLKNIGAGNADVTVTQLLSGLTPGTTYSYCIRSSNSAGSQNGSCVSFTTAAAGGPPTATTLSATNITQTSAVLRGKVNPNGLSTDVDFASCDPSASPSYFLPTPLKNIGAGNAEITVTETLSGLTPGTTYSYCIRSVNSAGSQNGSCVSFTTSSGAVSAVLTTNKPDYSLGETVHFTLTNTGGSAITGTMNNPWVIYKQVGFSWQTAYVPGVALQNWTLNPGDTKSWSWGQTSNAMVPIDAGTYKVEVDLSGVGTWDTTFTIGMGGGVGTGSLRIYNTTADYDIYIDGAYVATALTATVTLHNIPTGVHQVRLTKANCTDIVETVTINSGATTSIHVSMVCNGQPPAEADGDGDGVPDDEDNCYNPDCNLVDNRGCPKDTDRDGLNDCEDDCPTEKGLPADDGCPAGDKDGDGVPDDEDSCYNPGCTNVDSQGCPKDTDDDGLNDCEDDCPNQSGPRNNNGCPEEGAKDSDSDGVPDEQDQCYNPGCNRVDSRGCPWDSDNDGLNDCEDNCPNQSGPRSNNGCPEGPSFCLGSVLLSILLGLGLFFKH